MTTYYTKRIILMSERQALPFKSIALKTEAELGSRTKAAKALGVSRNTLDELIENTRLTDKMARIILENRKTLRAKNGG